MKKAAAVFLVFALALLLAACGGNDASVVSASGKNGEALKVRLADVWQDADGKVMVSLQGLGKGKLLDTAAQMDASGQVVGRYARPYVKARIRVGGEWLDAEEIPSGMFSNADNGSYTARFDATELPDAVEIGGATVELEGLTLAGVDRQALLDAEAEETAAREAAAQQREAAAQQRLADAQIVPPKSEPDLAWTNNISLASGEALYWAATGLENADSVVVSFVLSADGKSAHTLRADLVNGRANGVVYSIQNTLMMSYPVTNGRLVVEESGFMLDVTIDGDRAEGVLDLGVSSGRKDAFGRDAYESLGIARVEMTRR